MSSLQCIVLLERLLRSNRKLAHPVPRASTKIEIAKGPACGAPWEPIPKKKDQRVSTIAYRFAVMAHTHQLVWYPVWSVRETATRRNPRPVGTKTAKLAQPIPTRISQQPTAKNFADPNAPLDNIRTLAIPSTVSALLAFLARGARSTLTNALRSLVSMVVSARTFLKDIDANANQINPCTANGNPCKNEATCTALLQGRYKCDCQPGWDGQHCEINIDVSTWLMIVHRLLVKMVAPALTCWTVSCASADLDSS
ncbi:unnamed protein product, partial [Nesidiocoris tenuis]